MIIQQGGVKMLMGFAREGSVEGMRHAAQCVARVGIQTNPQLTFPGQRYASEVFNNFNFF